MYFWSVSSCLPLLLVESCCLCCEIFLLVGWLLNLTCLDFPCFAQFAQIRCFFDGLHSSFLRKTIMLGELIILWSVWEWGVPPKVSTAQERTVGPALRTAPTVTEKQLLPEMVQIATRNMLGCCYVYIYIYICLVVWNMNFIFPIILGMSSSQLTNSYFSEG